MLRIADLILGWLLLIGGVLHGIGSVATLDFLSPILVWALSGSLAAMLLAALNLMRVNRPADRTLAWVCLAGCIGWIAIAVAFASTLSNPIDPRALYHVVVTLALAALSLRAALGPASAV
jgi:peptidoglycan/LPS O-acetylase OafA/YrhL